MIQELLEAFGAMSNAEVIAAILGVGYVLLAASKRPMAWPFAFVSTLIYTVIFWEGSLVASSVLNFYYMIMAIYGYFAWGKTQEQKSNKELVPSQHLALIATGLIATALLGYINGHYFGARYAYVDAGVMLFSAIATWLMTQKILSNWLYWIVIDSVAAWLYWQMGYIATVALFVLYVALAFYGQYRWKRD